MIRRALVLAAVSTSVFVLPVAPALANHNRQHTCESAGGVFQGASNPNNETCTFTTVVVGPAVPTGEVTTTFGEARPVGDSTFVDSPPVPAGEATEDREVRNVGDPVAVPVTVAGTPRTTTRTEEGETTSTEAAGTQNCQRVNNERGARNVEKCERTVVTTSTTPTTVFTTVTTPQERVTTTTQAREECVTTTQPTEFTRTTTQPTEREQTVTPETETTTTTTRTTFTFTGGPRGVPTVPSGTPQVSTSTAKGTGTPVVTTVPGEPIITVETLEGDPIVTGPVCTPIEPVITEERETLEPLSVTTDTPGEPIVETSTRGTGQSCFKNASTAEQRRNAC